MDFGAKFPNELWTKVFESYPGEDVFTTSPRQIFTSTIPRPPIARRFSARRAQFLGIALTCRRFCGLVQTILWSEIVLPSRDISVRGTLVSMPIVAGLVRKADFLSQEKKLGQEHLDDLKATLSLLSSLELLSVSGWAAGPEILSMHALRSLTLHFPPNCIEAYHTEDGFMTTHTQQIEAILMKPSLSKLQLSWVRHQKPAYVDQQSIEAHFHDLYTCGAILIKDVTYIGLETSYSILTSLVIGLQQPKRIVLVTDQATLGLRAFAIALNRVHSQLEELVLSQLCWVVEGRLALLSPSRQGNLSGGAINVQSWTTLVKLAITIRVPSEQEPIHTTLPHQLKALQLGFNAIGPLRVDGDPEAEGVAKGIIKHLDGLIECRSVFPDLKKVIYWSTATEIGNEMLPWLKWQLPLYWMKFQETGIEFCWSLATATEDTPIVCGHRKPAADSEVAASLETAFREEDVFLA